MPPLSPERHRAVGGRPDSTRAAALLVTAALSIATANVLVRRAFSEGSEPGAVLAIRLLLPGIAFGIWASAARLRRSTGIKSLTLPGSRALAFAAAFGVGLYVLNWLELQAVQRLPVPFVVLLLSLAPLWVALARRAFWRETMSRQALAGLVLAVSGVAVMVGVPAAGVSYAGIGFGLIESVVAATGFMVLEGPLSAQRPESLLAGALLTAGTIAVVATPGAFRDELSPGGSRARLVLFAALLFGITLLCTIKAVRASNAYVTALATTAEPLFATLISWLVLDETLSAAQAVGGALVVLGVALTFVDWRSPRPTVRSAHRT